MEHDQESPDPLSLEVWLSTSYARHRAWRKKYVIRPIETTLAAATIWWWRRRKDLP